MMKTAINNTAKTSSEREKFLIKDKINLHIISEHIIFALIICIYTN
jgi:hypothetical protein